MVPLILGTPPYFATPERRETQSETGENQHGLALNASRLGTDLVNKHCWSVDDLG